MLRRTRCNGQKPKAVAKAALRTEFAAAYIFYITHTSQLSVSAPLSSPPTIRDPAALRSFENRARNQPGIIELIETT
jgi:hypothetical protein